MTLQLDRKQKITVYLLIALVVLGGAVVLGIRFKHEATVRMVGTYKAAYDPTFNKRQFSLSDPNSIWVVVNKKRPLNPADYTPADFATPHFLLTNDPTDSEMQVRPEVATALGVMYSAASKKGIDLLLSSGYRSYQEQKQTLDQKAQQDGSSQAQQESARNGYSEHQTGLAADIGVKGAECLAEPCFADTKAGKWVAANAYKYGFIIRYPQGKEAVTGYEYEPWHVRYVGVSLATEMKKKHIATLEEFFDLGPAPNYN